MPRAPPERITHGGSNVNAPRASMDGTGIFYKREQGDGPLLFQPLADGEARPVIPCVRISSFSITSAGVYYVPCARAGEVPHDAPVRVFDPVTGKDRLFAMLDDIVSPAVGGLEGGLFASPDGRTLLYMRRHTRETDLMLIEHFR